MRVGNSNVPIRGASCKCVELKHRVRKLDPRYGLLSGMLVDACAILLAGSTTALTRRRAGCLKVSSSWPKPDNLVVLLTAAESEPGLGNVHASPATLSEGSNLLHGQVHPKHIEGSSLKYPGRVGKIALCLLGDKLDYKKAVTWQGLGLIKAGFVCLRRLAWNLGNNPASNYQMPSQTWDPVPNKICSRP